jgi:hypothetical protein
MVRNWDEAVIAQAGDGWQLSMEADVRDLQRHPCELGPLRDKLLRARQPTYTLHSTPALRQVNPERQQRTITWSVCWILTWHF